MKWLQRFLAAVAIVVVVLSIVRFGVFWNNEAYLENVSGLWAALADDFSEGVFYRPVLSPEGYGGVRYFPLHFVLHGALMRAVDDPVRTGQVLAGLSMLLLLFGVRFVLLRLGVGPMLAASSAAVVLASQAAQGALLQMRTDALAAGLNLWGLGLCLGTALGPRRAAWASLLFTLAFAAKPTAIYGALAAGVWLALAGRRRDAWTIALGAALGWVAVLSVIHWGSDGWGTHIVRSGGLSDVTVANLLRAPFVLARIAREVPETLVFIQLGLAAWIVAALEGRLFSAPSVWVAATLTITVGIFVFEGTDTNHLLALHAASIVMVAVTAMAGDRLRMLALSVLAVSALAASLSLASGLANRQAEQQRGTFAETLALIPADDRPVLAENPLVAVVRGERPYILNPYMFRLVRAQNPAFAEPLWEALREQRFAAVVLERDPHSERGQDWYRNGYFGEGFVEEVERTYQRAGSAGARVVYLPRPR